MLNVHTGFEQHREASRSPSKYARQAGGRSGYLTGTLHDMDEPQSSEHVVADHLAINTTRCAHLCHLICILSFIGLNDGRLSWPINNMDRKMPGKQAVIYECKIASGSVGSARVQLPLKSLPPPPS